MHFLVRILAGLFFLWLICNYFYSLGRKSGMERGGRKRKKVDSSVVEDDD